MYSRLTACQTHKGRSVNVSLAGRTTAV
jgi:hypothetical protein